MLVLNAKLFAQNIFWVTVQNYAVQIHDHILAAISREGDTIEFDNPVVTEGNVEVWLNSLLMESQSSLHSIIRTAAEVIQVERFNLIDFLNGFCAQVGWKIRL